MHHPPGCHLIGNRYYFTVYAPHAKRVSLAFFETCAAETPLKRVPMRSSGHGNWEFSDIVSMEGLYYAYYLDDNPHPVCDPYARFVSTFQDYRQDAKALIYHDEFSWENDSFIATDDPRDLVIYECHIADMTADHPRFPCSFLGMISKIPYLKELGISAIELLPIQKFTLDEPPYKEITDGVVNDWNPYSENHWGYMTSYFFAPESRYASGNVRSKGQWADTRGREGHELKTMIKAFHDAGIAVIMDVVYNHVSHYDNNPLRTLAQDDYILHGHNDSGCGNDLNTQHPVTRRLILDSLIYWMQEYHVDGFRFDLAGILDDETLQQIKEKCSKINSNVILYGEPWGRRYFPEKMSELGLGVWNDRFRNGIKGENPSSRQGFIFGKWDHHVNPNYIFTLLTGSLKERQGMFCHSSDSVNYLSSHDGYTFGDFIRISMPASTRHGKKDSPVLLSDQQELIYRLGMFMLIFSQGMLMLHAGQEYARSKVIAERPEAGALAGKLDHNSYNKDDATNYMDFTQAEENSGIKEYVADLIAIRHEYVELRAADPAACQAYFCSENEFALGYSVESPKLALAVLINSSQEKAAEFDLKYGDWCILANEKSADKNNTADHPGRTLNMDPQSCCLLMRKK